MIYMGMSRQSRSLGSGPGYSLYLLWRTPPQKDAAPIPHATLVFITKLCFYRFISDLEKVNFVNNIISDRLHPRFIFCHRHERRIIQEIPPGELPICLITM